MNERILIVEDEPQMLRLLGMTLEKDGYRISAAQTAAAARAQIQAAVPDVIILDVMLPDMSGLELCRVLRLQPTTSAVPILMLSALGQVADKIAGLKAGADEYIVKPIDALELVARIGSLLERTRRMRGEGGDQQGKVVTFLGSKGGVGTTTAVVNVGACLVAQGVRAIAAELRAGMGQMHAMLGLAAGDGMLGLLALDPQHIHSKSISGWVVRHTSGLQVLPAPTEISPEARIEGAQALAIIAGLTSLADTVLFDLPPFPSPEGEAALGVSDRVLMTMEPTRLGLEAASVMATYAKAHARPAADLRVVVISRAPLATPISARQIQERFGWTVLGGVPPAPDDCARAQQLGTPLIQAAPDSTATEAFKQLARAIA